MADFQRCDPGQPGGQRGGDSIPHQQRASSADSLVPGGSALAFDRYAYVLNSPLNATDPSGHTAFRSVDGDLIETSLVNIYLTVNLATSGIKRGYWNTVTDQAAQYDYTPSPSLRAGHNNLCGDIALSMIYETVTGKTDTLGLIFSGSPGTRAWNEGTNTYELAQQFAACFPSGWQAKAYYLNYEYWFSAGNTWHTKDSPGVHKSSLTTITYSQLYDRFAQMLDDGNYVIAGVRQDIRDDARLDPTGVGHWVVVTGIKGNEVYINNPFTNEEQIYTWQEFYDAFNYWSLEIIPADPNPPVQTPIAD